jgi:glycosyltransferase involved in cell wall biosynthesis
MKRITAVIPTLNRPALLGEAIQSLLNQTHAPAEIIVVDDGSNPPVDTDALTLKYGPKIRVIRHEVSRGLAYARNHGAEEATGDYLVHLDDDDLLAPETLEEAYALLTHNPDIDVIFLGDEGFGPHAGHFNRVQPEGVARVCEIGKGHELAPGVVYFDRELMDALLRTVPTAFQRVILKKQTWSNVSSLRWRAYQLEADTPDIETVKRRITGQLRDSEWAIYAASICQKTVLINRKRYLFRCEGQSLSSRPANRERHMLQILGIKAQLFRASLALPELHNWKKEIRQSLAAAQLHAAYHYFQMGNRAASWKYLRQALYLNPNLNSFRFAFRMWLPRASKH